ncbi:MAG: BON domain-containing protein [Rhodospirillales bacterium]|nr:BON domain-containing protein [Rhodospirillales bacterium]
MSKTKSIFAVTILLASFSLGACTPTILSEAAQSAFEDRITEDQITDLKIASYLLKQLIETDKNLALDVAIDVWEQRMLLTGGLDNSEAINQVLALASADSRVKTLYNEIRLVSTSERDQRRSQAENRDSAESGGVQQTVNDYWLETKIKGQLLTAKDVRSVNYRWRSVINTIYIIGRARSQSELDVVLAIITETKGVRNVKSFVEIKPVS